MLWRAARRGRRAWWFCNCGDCRFDLAAPRGTCYVGTDRLCGLLETIGPEWVKGAPLTPEFLRRRTLRAAALVTLPLANLTSRRALGFRVTNELSDMTPYDIPRAFAGVLDDARRSGKRRYGGIRYRTRFDTGPRGRGVAMFGDAGLLDGVSEIEEQISEDVLDALADLGVVIQVPPVLADLIVIDS